MKKIIALFITIALLLTCCTACGSTKPPEENGDKKLSIVTTIFPEYDWVNQILGDQKENAEVTMLFRNGVDLHSFQPTADDIITISDCDLFIYVGGESDEWAEDALEEANNKSMFTVNLLEVLGDRLKEEETVEGMQPEREGEEKTDETEIEYDEHVWLSLRNAEVLCSAIKDALCRLDPNNADVYTANAEAYVAQLQALDTKYQRVIDSSVRKTLLFGDRFPFRYLTEDYGLKYYAAFKGCAADCEVSFDTIVFLAQKADELKLPVILTLDGSDQKIAKTIRSSMKNQNVSILSLDSLQSAAADADRGSSYLSVMEKNLEVLKKALL